MEKLKRSINPMRRYFLTLTLLCLSSLGLMAQNGETSTFWTSEVVLTTTLVLVFITAILVLIVAVYVLQMLKTFLLKDMSEESRAKYKAEPSYWAKLWDKWNDLKPVEQESEIMLDHDYDGIKELDNHLPPWWKGLFYLTIGYAVVYILIFHVFQTQPLQAEQYEQEMAAAKKFKDAIPVPVVEFDENTVTMTLDAGDLLEGKKILEMRCGTCHKNDGGGMAGPNLTDEYWKHGGGIVNIYKTIKNGVPNTVMIPWENSLNPVKLRQVSSYVMSLQGTNPVDGKAPEGEIWKPESSEEGN